MNYAGESFSLFHFARCTVMNMKLTHTHTHTTIDTLFPCHI